MTRCASRALRGVFLLSITLPAVALANSESPDWSGLPAELKKIVILYSSQVPPYPEGDSLMQVRRWPKTRTFDGQAYTLTFFANEYDLFKFPIARFSDIEPGWNYGAYYERNSKNGNASVRRGPWHSWRSDSSIAERIYVTSSSTRTWGYDSSGVLTAYTEHLVTGDRKVPEVRHFYGLDGRLIGLIAYSSTFGKTHTKAYWMGWETSTDELLDKVFARSRHKPH